MAGEEEESVATSPVAQRVPDQGRTAAGRRSGQSPAAQRAVGPPVADQRSPSTVEPVEPSPMAAQTRGTNIQLMSPIQSLIMIMLLLITRLSVKVKWVPRAWYQDTAGRAVKESQSMRRRGCFEKGAGTGTVGGTRWN